VREVFIYPPTKFLLSLTHLQIGEGGGEILSHLVPRRQHHLSTLISFLFLSRLLWRSAPRSSMCLQAFSVHSEAARLVWRRRSLEGPAPLVTPSGTVGRCSTGMVWLPACIRRMFSSGTHVLIGPLLVPIRSHG
jgi:hypothetical protein